MTPAAGFAQVDALEPRRLLSSTLEVQLLGTSLPAELPVGMHATAHTVRVAVRPTEATPLPKRVRLEVSLADESGRLTRVGTVQLGTSRLAVGREVITTARLRVPASLAEGTYQLVVVSPALVEAAEVPSTQVLRGLTAVPARVDLELTSTGRLLPDSPGLFSIEPVVSNLGNAAFRGTVVVQTSLQIDEGTPVIIDSRPVRLTLAAGQQLQLSPTQVTLEGRSSADTVWRFESKLHIAGSVAGESPANNIARLAPIVVAPAPSDAASTPPETASPGTASAPPATAELRSTSVIPYAHPVYPVWPVVPVVPVIPPVIPVVPVYPTFPVFPCGCFSSGFFFFTSWGSNSFFFIRF